MKYPPEVKALSLDLGSDTGFAVLANGIVTSGTKSFTRRHGRKTLPDDHEGIIFHDFTRWLKDTIRENHPKYLIYEEPMGHWKNASAPRMIYGLRGVLFSVSCQLELPLFNIPQTALKLFAVGKGNADKDLMRETAIRHFSTSQDISHNEADALFILRWFIEEVHPKVYLKELKELC
jgi:Holliday junction resolvasome RuvABC endonuclease subunit